MKIYEIPIFHESEGKRNIIFPERVSESDLVKMESDHGPYTFSCQYLLNPIPESEKKFVMDWLLYWDELPKFLKILMCVDPANQVKKRSDYSAISVHGWDSHQNWYILDVFRDKFLNEDQRANKVIAMHKKWSKFSQISVKVLYETLGFQILDEHNLQRKMREKEYYFQVIQMAGGILHKTRKVDRITALQPYFARNKSNEPDRQKVKIYVPRTAIHYSIYNKQNVDMMQKGFLYEYMFFTPNSTHEHDDILDTCTFPLYWDGFKTIQADKLPDETENDGYTVQHYLDTLELEDQMNDPIRAGHL